MISQLAEKTMTPVLKWAGGKSQILEEICANMPVSYNSYYEPFIGGGAVFLAIAPEKAFINDTNEQLINLYKQLRLAPAEILKVIEYLDNIPCNREVYFSIRHKYNEKISRRELDAECAALMIWINKHCFNGLYRVNGKGLFNVPYNNKINGKSVDSDAVMQIGKFLQSANITISCCDFETACQNVEEDDFVYFDSPYVPISKTADFTSYTKDGFTLEDHKRLASLFKRLDGIGAKVMLSNNDVPLVRELYSGYNFKSLAVKRLINCNALKRTGHEVLITNY